MMAKQVRGTKTDAIRLAIEQDANVSPKELAEKLSKQGLKVTAAYVSTIKHQLQKRAAKLPAAKQPTPTPKHSSNGHATGLIDRLKSSELVSLIDKAEERADILREILTLTMRLEALDA